MDALDKHQRSALHWAAEADKPEVAKLLLAKGASTTLADEDKNQPLHLAALAGSVEVTRLLLAKKADPNLANRREFTPLHLAVFFGHARRFIVRGHLRAAVGRLPRVNLAQSARHRERSSLRARTQTAVIRSSELQRLRCVQRRARAKRR